MVGCVSAASDSEIASEPAPVVKLIDPIPTFENGDLVVHVGAGREIEADVTPATALEQVELRLDDPPSAIGRVAHAPFRFFVPASVLGEGGERILCVVATDARARSGEACFHAVR
jgi:hypothetical protein